MGRKLVGGELTHSSRADETHHTRNRQLSQRSAGLRSVVASIGKEIGRDGRWETGTWTHDVTGLLCDHGGEERLEDPEVGGQVHTDRPDRFGE